MPIMHSYICRHYCNFDKTKPRGYRMILNRINTWPAVIVDFLDQNQIFLIDYHSQKQCSEAESRSLAFRLDQVVSELKAILSTSDFTATGYHSTRLTLEEADQIKQHGMDLPNGNLLKQRIRTLVSKGRISETIGKALQTENQADDKNRAGMIWFCFYLPHSAGESGIGRLFMSWGGEALYNSHENNPVTGKVLKQIGIPCVIQAKIPIAGLDTLSLAFNMIGTYLKGKSNYREPTRHDNYSLMPIKAENITKIIKFPSYEFNRLTRHTTWRTQLQGEVS